MWYQRCRCSQTQEWRLLHHFKHCYGYEEGTLQHKRHQWGQNWKNTRSSQKVGESWIYDWKLDSSKKKKCCQNYDRISCIWSTFRRRDWNNVNYWGFRRVSNRKDSISPHFVCDNSASKIERRRKWKGYLHWYWGNIQTLENWTNRITFWTGWGGSSLEHKICKRLHCWTLDFSTQLCSSTDDGESSFTPDHWLNYGCF